MNNGPYLTLRNQTELIRCKIAEIAAITCDGYCSTLHFISQQETFSLCKSLKCIEGVIPEEHPFIRTSRNTMINVENIKRLNTLNRKATLVDGTIFDVSVRKLKELIKALESLN